MAAGRTISTEETLDPDDWEAMRLLGHRMVDDMLRHLQGLRERPAWQHASRAVKAHFEGEAPLDPQPLPKVYDEFRQYILPHVLGNVHPRFWGWVGGSGTVSGALAEFLAAASNAPSGGFSFVSPNYVERQVLDWCKQIFGFPREASGLLTSGGSASNLVGLTVARNARAGYDLRRLGVAAAPKPMVMYASSESHSSVEKAVQMLGLGSDHLRIIPVNAAMQMDLRALRSAIAADRKAGLAPFCVVGGAGTTNTGSIDNLDTLADICEEENLWFHVDGAFGAWAAISPESRRLVAGMERADSLAFDFHKWMYIPYPIGGVLVRREADHRNTFSLNPAYLAHGTGDRGLTAEDVPWQSDYGYELSRGFPALKAWMSIKEHGVRKFARVIQKNIDQARYLAGLVRANPQLELALEPGLNVVCFRYVGAGLDDPRRDEVNKQIEIELQEQGIAIPSIVTLNGRRYLHAAITNHRSQRADFDLLVREVLRLGAELSEPGRAALPAEP